jgi:MFS superfamily sulfate permease-like transporter
MSKTLSDFRRRFRQEFPITMETLSNELIWPAAAGNVTWAFVRLTLKPPPQNGAAYLLLLLLIALYLVIDWLRSRSALNKTWKYWVGDSCLVIGIVVLSIAVQSGKSQVFLHWTLAVVFGTGTIGHLTGAWVESTDNNWTHRVSMAACGIVGLAILAGSYCACHELLPVALPVSFAIVLVAWITARTILNERNKALCR